MVQLQTFPIKFERNLARVMPTQASTIVHRIARDIVRSSKHSEQLEKQLEFGHAKLHMQLYQRFGRRTGDFSGEAHQALDDLVRNRQSTTATPSTLLQSLS